jgi:hypothetical protein
VFPKPVSAKTAQRVAQDDRQRLENGLQPTQ